MTDAPDVMKLVEEADALLRYPCGEKIALEMVRRLASALTEAHEAGRREGVEEIGWLIERNDLGAPQWLQFGPGYGNTSFWPDANKAMRFARKIDAETFIAMHEASDPALRATEHKWIGDRAFPARTFREGVEAAAKVARDKACFCVDVAQLREAEGDHEAAAPWRMTYSHVCAVLHAILALTEKAPAHD